MEDYRNPTLKDGFYNANLTWSDLIYLELIDHYSTSLREGKLEEASEGLQLLIIITSQHSMSYPQLLRILDSFRTKVKSTFVLNKIEEIYHTLKNTTV